MAPKFVYTAGLEKTIDYTAWEKDEQALVRESVKPGACVLELGARFGVVSWAIQEKLADKKKHVAVEADSVVIPALEANRDNNGCEYKIINGVVGSRNAYCFYLNAGSFVLFDDEIEIKKPDAVTRNFTHFSIAKKYSWDELEEMAGTKFDTIVADIEGSFPEFIREHQHKLGQIKTVMYERDGRSGADYAFVDSVLTENGFSMSNTLGDQRVYVKAW
jgi:hypothetical protein